MKDNNKFNGKFLKGLRKKCEDCDSNIPIPRDILNKSRKLECPKCGAIYRALISGNTFEFIIFQKNNK